MKTSRFNAPRQKGVASLIFVLLVSLAITAASTSVIQTIRKNQQISTAVNATTHSETGMWAAAEAFRIYLQSLEELDILALSGHWDIVMDASFGDMVVRDMDPQPVAGEDGTYRVSAKIVNHHPVARSSSSLDVVYEIDLDGGGVLPAAASVNFNDSLVIGGNINITNNGEPVDLNVVGDLEIKGVSVNPINQINATGKVELGSKVTVNSIYSEDEIILRNSIVQLVEGLGNVTVTGSASIDKIQANGDVKLEASGHFEEVYSRKSIIAAGGGTHGLLNALETVSVTNSNGVDSVASVGNVDLSWGRVTSVVTEGNIKCPGTSWTQTSFLSANGTLINCPPAAAGRTVESGAGNVVGVKPELTPKPFETSKVDVWAFKDSANYFVWYDSTNDQIKVEVNSVEGFTDGDVRTLGEIPGSPPHFLYLCENVNASGKCPTTETPTVPLCFGQTPWNDGCIKYNPGSKTFEIKPAQTAPGVIFFDGNLKLTNGHAVSTMLASGNITVANGGFIQEAVNFGSYDKVCLANADNATSQVRTRYTLAYSTHYPTNLCDIPNTDYLPKQLGNIALAAGGINPDLTVNPDGNYTGGDITFDNSATITGAVLAGNLLNTSGHTIINGAVSAGSQGTDGSGNKLGSTTIIDFSSTGDFDPTDIPDFGGPPKFILIPTAEFVWARSS